MEINGEVEKSKSNRDLNNTYILQWRTHGTYLATRGLGPSRLLLLLLKLLLLLLLLLCVVGGRHGLPVLAVGGPPLGGSRRRRRRRPAHPAVHHELRFTKIRYELGPSSKKLYEYLCL